MDLAVEDPVTFLRDGSPWRVVAAPLAAVCLRLTLASIVEIEGAHYQWTLIESMRTALEELVEALPRSAAPA